MRAVMLLSVSFEGLAEVRVMSTSSHQSSSTVLGMPQSVNHFLRPLGTKNCTPG